MKNVLYIVLMTLSLLNLAGCKATAAEDTPLIVEGRMENVAYLDAVGLYRVVDGQWECVATTKLDEEGRYVFAVAAPRTELLAIGMTTNTATNNKAIFCGKNGDRVRLRSTEKIERYTFEGEVSRYNQVLEKWEQAYQDALPDNIATYTFRELYPKVDGFLKASKDYAAQVKGNDPEFDAYLKMFIETQAKFGLLYFHFLPKNAQPTKEELLPLMATIGEEFPLESPLYAGMPFCNPSLICLEANAMLHQTTFDLDRAADEVKANYFLTKMKGGYYGNYEDFSVGYEKYGKLLKTPAQQRQLEAFIEKNGYGDTGKPAKDFTYPDVDGKMVSLSDFKGKVVVVDVWATWCGPCKGEIPHLKKLEKEFEGRDDIVFLSVSVDKAKDKETWKKMIKDEQMGGIHLFADGFSQIAESYQITAIPRFMVFDKKGNIVSSNSPRPSDPRLRDMILRELQK